MKAIFRLCTTRVSLIRGSKSHQVRNKNSGKVYVVAESRFKELPSEKSKPTTLNGTIDDSKKSNVKSKPAKKETVEENYEILEKITGASLVGTK